MGVGNGIFWSDVGSEKWVAPPPPRAKNPQEYPPPSGLGGILIQGYFLEQHITYQHTPLVCCLIDIEDKHLCKINRELLFSSRKKLTAWRKDKLNVPLKLIAIDMKLKII